VRLLLSSIFVLHSLLSTCQITDEEKNFMSRMTPGTSLPEKLLSTRSAVFYSYTFTDKELESIQQTCQRSGIDAMAYFETDELLAGKDITVAYARYLIKREVTNLLFFQKSNKGYKVYMTEFNTKGTIVDQNQYAWVAEQTSLAELLRKIYQASGGGTKRLNMLINDVPEKDMEISIIDGRRSDFFAIDLKVDELAVTKTGNPEMDKALEETFSNYPYKFKIAEAGTTDQELRKKGSLYVLCYVHTRGIAAKKLLGYDMSKSESAIASITYPDSSTTSQLKNIPSNEYVYKFYFKHIDSGNVFLGTKWDADITFEKALKNHYRAFKAELKFN